MIKYTTNAMLSSTTNIQKISRQQYCITSKFIKMKKNNSSHKQISMLYISTTSTMTYKRKKTLKIKNKAKGRSKFMLK